MPTGVAAPSKDPAPRLEAVPVWVPAEDPVPGLVGVVAPPILVSVFTHVGFTSVRVTRIVCGLSNLPTNWSPAVVGLRGSAGERSCQRSRVVSGVSTDPDERGGECVGYPMFASTEVCSYAYPSCFPRDSTNSRDASPTDHRLAWTSRPTSSQSADKRCRESTADGAGRRWQGDERDKMQVNYEIIIS